jgi:TolB protein
MRYRETRLRHLRRFPPLILGTLAFVSANAASAQQPQTRTVIEIGNPDFRPYPIAVPEARDMAGGQASATTELVTVTLRNDFDLASIFKVLDPQSYLADPKKEGMAAASIKFSDWVSIGAEGLVKAGLTISGDTLRADFRFFDVASGRQLLQKNYGPGKLEDGRKFAHQFANEVVFYLTGQKGIFMTKILAVRKTKTGREIYVIDVDGENQRAVTANGSINLLPSWSRSGREVIFTSYIRHNPNLYSVSVEGGNPKLLSGERGLNTGGVMSPDGKKIALTLSRDGNSEIYVMNADGSNLVRLTNEWAIDSSPTWSPDGKRIAFVSARWGDPHIFVMNADGSGARRVTDRGTYNQTPDWSPRGDLIAFTARDERNVFDIFTVNPDTKEIRRLTQDQGNNEEPSFSPDGTHLVFTSTREGGSNLWACSFDGSNQKRLTKKGGFTTPAWSPYLE